MQNPKDCYMIKIDTMVYLKNSKKLNNLNHIAVLHVKNFSSLNQIQHSKF